MLPWDVPTWAKATMRLETLLGRVEISVGVEGKLAGLIQTAGNNGCRAGRIGSLRVDSKDASGAGI